ncbi:MAG: TatD family hydrolase [Deltaproteobacteria bacterium]|nr:TatD family hydrolase [Deltaproteobacteria bacterium]
MILFDTHAHMCDPVFDADRAEVISRAKATGVKAIISVGETVADVKKNLKLASLYDELKPAAGLYPTRLNLEEADAMVSLIRKNRNALVAIGEVGLDYWIVKDEADRETQRKIFKTFIYLSLELDLPLNVHSRSAGRHAIQILLESKAQKVQLHAFDAKTTAAIPAIEAGYFFSIPTSVIRSRQKQKLVKQLPLSSLLIETDSPVLGPTGQERNEPANVLIALKAIARIKNLSEQEIMEAVAGNTRRLYGDLTT